MLGYVYFLRVVLNIATAQLYYLRTLRIPLVSSFCFTLESAEEIFWVGYVIRFCGFFINMEGIGKVEVEGLKYSIYLSYGVFSVSLFYFSLDFIMLRLMENVQVC